MDNRFTDIFQLIKQSRTIAIKAVNVERINLYVKQENYSKRELDRQISASLFERTMIGKLRRIRKFGCYLKLN